MKKAGRSPGFFSLRHSDGALVLPLASPIGCAPAPLPDPDVDSGRGAGAAAGAAGSLRVDAADGAASLRGLTVIGDGRFAGAPPLEPVAAAAEVPDEPELETPEPPPAPMDDVVVEGVLAEDVPPEEVDAVDGMLPADGAATRAGVAGSGARVAKSGER